MFGRFKRLINNVYKLNEQKIFLEIVSKDNIQKFIIDLNRFDQIFDAGIDVDGNELPEYSQYTELVSSDDTFTATSFSGESLSKQKEFGESFFLLAKGDMYNAFKVVVKGDGFHIVNNKTIKKSKGETTDYRDLDILGLTNGSKSELAEKIIPLVVREVKLLLLS